jgi:branched-chain amino acid transport system permease protein
VSDERGTAVDRTETVDVDQQQTAISGQSTTRGERTPGGSWRGAVAGAARRTPLLVIVAVLAILPLLDVGTGGVLPAALSEPGSLQLLGLCLVFGALALTYDLLFGFTGLLSFGHALFFAVGVYVTEIAMGHLGLGLGLAVLVAIGAGLAVSLFVGAISLRVGGIAFAMVTLAFAQAGSIIVGQDPHGLTGGELGQSLTFEQVPGALVGVVNTRHLYWLALVLLVVVYVVVTWSTRSAPGRIWQAIRENERRVQVLGLRPYSFKLLSFVVASVLAGLCGIVYLLLVGGAHPAVTTPEFTLSLLVMVVLGGAGSRWGAVLGGFIYSYLDQRLPAFASSDAVASLPSAIRVPLSQPLFILGLLFVLVILFLPGGIAGTLSRRGSPRTPLSGFVARLRRRAHLGPAAGDSQAADAEPAQTVQAADE